VGGARPGIFRNRGNFESQEGKQLSERTGIAQTDISKLERGNANPSLRTLQRLATGMGMRVKIEFVPENVSTAL
jgi:toxin-antitoxin system, antitoxin component, xre family